MSVIMRTKSIEIHDSIVELEINNKFESFFLSCSEFEAAQRIVFKVPLEDELTTSTPHSIMCFIDADNRFIMQIHMIQELNKGSRIKEFDRVIIGPDITEGEWESALKCRKGSPRPNFVIYPVDEDVKSENYAFSLSCKGLTGGRTSEYSLDDVAVKFQLIVDYFNRVSDMGVCYEAS